MQAKGKRYVRGKYCFREAAAIPLSQSLPAVAADILRERPLVRGARALMDGIRQLARDVPNPVGALDTAYIEGGDLISRKRNTFKDIKLILPTLGDACGTRFEFECYDAGSRPLSAW